MQSFVVTAVVPSRLQCLHSGWSFTLCITSCCGGSFTARSEWLERLLKAHNCCLPTIGTLRSRTLSRRPSPPTHAKGAKLGLARNYLVSSRIFSCFHTAGERSRYKFVIRQEKITP